MTRAMKEDTVESKIEPSNLTSGGNGSVIQSWGPYRHAFAAVYKNTITIAKMATDVGGWKFILTLK